MTKSKSEAFPEPRAAIVTGAGQRIGRAIALGLGAAGWAVAVHHKGSSAEAEETVAAIECDGGHAVALNADLADEEETSTLMARATEALGPLACLVNNASLFEYDDAASTTRESWEAHMSVNLRAPFILAQTFAAGLPVGAAGVIINILDQRVWNLTPHFMSYTVSKAGLWTLTQTLALALAPTIRVNAIGPGPVLPNTRQSETQFRVQCESTPLGHGASPQEISDAVRFILAAPAMTGQMLALDGGQHLGWAKTSTREVEE